MHIDSEGASFGMVLVRFMVGVLLHFPGVLAVRCCMRWCLEFGVRNENIAQWVSDGSVDISPFLKMCVYIVVRRKIDGECTLDLNTLGALRIVFDRSS